MPVDRSSPILKTEALTKTYGTHTALDHLDLTVPLSIELGRTKLTAGAILALEVNAIVQLARSTGEGVDVVADSHRLARGEIVMIEDRTGIRINDVCEQEGS